MKICKFTLKGKTAFFKKPDINSMYFTYGNIHKIAILGIFGAILGYGGYNQMSAYNSINKKSQLEYPEFYSQLRDIKIAIIPNNKEGFFEKKIQVFNNTVGYASAEEGGNLIVKEQWIENPSWDIYFQIKDDLSKKLYDYISNNKTIYIPYLGKNDHRALIENCRLYEKSDINIILNPNRINSLFKESTFGLDVNFDEEEIDEDEEYDYQYTFKYQERLPIALQKQTNLYITEKFIFTNMNLYKKDDTEIFCIDNKNIVFF